MKNITNPFPKNKISGIYKISILVGKHEFAYVSNAEHIYGSIKQHRNEISKHFNNSNTTQELLNNYGVPENNKKFFHFAIFLLAKNNKLELKNINYEILEEVMEFENKELVDDIEQKYIEQLQCEKYGFNSPFKYLEQFIQATMHNMEGKIERVKALWVAQEKRISEIYAPHDQEHIDDEVPFVNPTNAFILLDRGYVQDSKQFFKKIWKEYFDNLK